MRKVAQLVPLPTVPLIDVDPIQRIGYTPDEAAVSMGMGKTLVFALIKEGKLGVVRLGKKVLIPVEEIQDFMRRELTRAIGA